MRWSLKAVLIHISLTAKDDEHLFRFLAHFLNGSFISMASLLSLCIVRLIFVRCIAHSLSFFFTPSIEATNLYKRFLVLWATSHKLLPLILIFSLEIEVHFYTYCCNKLFKTRRRWLRWEGQLHLTRKEKRKRRNCHRNSLICGRVYVKERCRAVGIRLQCGRMLFQLQFKKGLWHLSEYKHLRRTYMGSSYIGCTTLSRFGRLRIHLP